MSRLIDDDLDDGPQRERELTLSTGSILGIFLGLLLLCAVFFGFGYNLGRKSSSTPNAALPPATTDSDSGQSANSAFDNFKPSPGSRAGAPASATTSTAVAAPHSGSPEPQPVTPGNVSKPVSTPAMQPSAALVHTVPGPSPAGPRGSQTSTGAAPHAAHPAGPAVTPGGAFVVQIAAISPAHKDDADLLANALHSKGYDVAERTETQDKLIRIQVGPFATKADAEAMRERLIVDGYNAIVK